MSAGSDTWASAPEIDLGANDPTPNAALTLEVGEPEDWQYRTAWWKYVAPDDSPLLLSTEATTPTTADTVLTVYTGSILGALTKIAQSDDEGTGYLSRLVLQDITPSETYWIQVGAWDETDADYVLTATVLTRGEWQEDGGIVSATSLQMLAGGTLGATDKGGVWWTSYSRDLAAPPWSDAWAGSGTVTSGATTDKNANEQAVLGAHNPTSDPAVPTQPASYGVEWRTTWFTLSRTDNPTIDTGVLPTSVYTGGAFVDPDVIGVEWEPTNTALAHSLTLQVHAYTESAELPATDAKVKLWDADSASTSTAVDPGFQSSGSVAALSTLASVTTQTGGVATPAAFLEGVAAPAGLPLNGPATLVVGAVDGFSDTTTEPSYDVDAESPTWRTELLTVALQSEFRPRYRLLYAKRGPKPLRQYPRTDGLATSSARRLWPPPRSVQRSNRRAGGYL